MSLQSINRFCILAAVTLAVTGCKETVSVPGPTSLEILAGPPAAGVPGDFLIDTLRVRLVDDEGKPQAGQTITWTILQGGGTVTALSPTTDASGIASAQWMLGPVAGVNSLEARSPEDSTAVFQTTAEAFRIGLFDSNSGLGCGLNGGDLWCWGQYSWVTNDPVSVGPFPFQYHYRAPGLVSQGQGFTTLAVGQASVCALDAGGVVSCFGTSASLDPSPSVPPLRHLAGSDEWDFCGLAKADSTAWCWNVISQTAAAVPGSAAFIDITIDDYGSGLRACGRLADSTAACWGAGPLGDGTFNSSASPVPVSGGHKFAKLAVGDDFGCGLEYGGDVWCWGRNDDGQLGIAGPDSPVPVLVTGGVSHIAAAIRTVIAIRFGTVVRWGLFQFGGSGNPVTPLPSVAGLPVSGFSLNDISCLTLVDNQIYCYDEIHVNSSTLDIDRYTPVQPVP